MPTEQEIVMKHGPLRHNVISKLKSCFYNHRRPTKTPNTPSICSISCQTFNAFVLSDPPLKLYSQPQSNSPLSAFPILTQICLLSPGLTLGRSAAAAGGWQRPRSDTCCKGKGREKCSIPPMNLDYGPVSPGWSVKCQPPSWKRKPNTKCWRVNGLLLESGSNYVSVPMLTCPTLQQNSTYLYLLWKWFGLYSSFYLMPPNIYMENNTSNWERAEYSA